MKFKFLDIYVTIIILVKLIFFMLAGLQIYFTIEKYTNTSLYLQIDKFWKERIEFIFVILMSGLLIYLFNPYSKTNKALDFETKLLLYLFGFILIITAKWSVFLEESPFLIKIQSSLRPDN